MHLVITGGSDAGISAALRAREIESNVAVTVIVADAFPNYSICGLPAAMDVRRWLERQKAELRTPVAIQQGNVLSSTCC